MYPITKYNVYGLEKTPFFGISSDKTQKWEIIPSFFQTSSHLNVHMKIHQGQAKTVLISEPVNPVQP